MTLMGMQDELLLPTVFAGWREISRDLKQKRVVEGMRRELVIGKAKATLMTLMRAQDELVLPTALLGWKEVVQESKVHNMIEAAEELLAHMKNMQYERVVEMLAQNSSTGNTQYCLAVWQEGV